MEPGQGGDSGQGRGDVSGQGKAALVGSREMVQPLDSWDTWARERKSSWGKKKVEETGSKWNRNSASAPANVAAPARPENAATPAQQQDYAEESLPDIQVMNIPAAVPALEVKKICEHFGGLAKFRYYSMLGDPGSRGYKQVLFQPKLRAGLLCHFKTSNVVSKLTDRSLSTTRLLDIISGPGNS